MAPDAKARSTSSADGSTNTPTVRLLGTALQTAINEWQYEAFQRPDPRLRASIVVGQDDPVSAVKEIERCAALGRHAQVNISPRANEPLGRRKYWPIYEAAQAAGLPLGIHVGGYGGHAPTASGWPSYYNEEHHSNAQSVAAQLSSLVIEGVPDHRDYVLSDAEKAAGKT